MSSERTSDRRVDRRGVAAPFTFEETASAAGSAPAGDAGRAVAFFRRVAAAIGEAEKTTDAAGIALQELCGFTGWPVGHALIVSSSGELSERWCASDPERFSPLRSATGRLVAARGRGLVHRLVALETPSLATSTSELEPERARAAEAAGVEAVCLIPVFADGILSGVLELFLEDGTQEPLGFSRDAVEFVRGQLEMHASLQRARRAVRRSAPRLRDQAADLAQMAAALRGVEETYALVRQAAGEGIWEWHIAEDRWSFSPRWAVLLGLRPDEVDAARETWFERIHPQDRGRVELELRDHLEGVTEMLVSRHRVLHTDGSFRWAVARGLALRDEAGTPVRMAGSLADISDLKLLEERAAQDLLYHPLTGFPRPALLVDRLEHAIRRGSRHPERHVAVVAVELEGLETVGVGIASREREELFLAIGRRIAALLRPSDSIGHGPEFPFAVLLEGVQSKEEAIEVAGRIEQGLREPFPAENRQIQLSPHLGVAFLDSTYEKPEAILLDAGLAAKQARRTGGVHLFDPADRAEGEAAADLETDLRAGLGREEFFLEYQPIVSLDDGRITAFETLVRWQHPSRGLVPPAQFLPIAEETGLIEELGYWILERGCRQMKAWEERAHVEFLPGLAVNLSERQFYDSELVPTTTGILKAVGLEFSRLRFDVSESAFMRDPSRARQVLTALQARGIRVAIDDFGTGFSSLSLLHRFPVSALKIDRWFVSGETAKLRNWDVAETVIELARILGLEVVAEGIETKEQFQHLRHLGCHQGQGFLFSGPVRPDEAARILKDGYPLDLTAPSR